MSIAERHHLKTNPKIADQCFLGSVGKAKFVFINIPKNASTSIRNLLRGCTFANYSELTDLSNRISLCLIRDPIPRAISGFLELLKLRGDGPSKVTRDSDFFKIRKDLGKSFESFLEFLSDDNFYDQHIFPQFVFLEHKGLTIAQIAQVFLVGESKDKLLEYFKQFTPKIAIPKAWASNSKKKQTLKDHVAANPQVREKILEIYAKDNELYQIVSARSLS